MCFFGTVNLLTDTGGAAAQGFRRAESCIDYRAYTHPIDPDVSPVRYGLACEQLRRVGQSCEERMGVVYVRGPWGFLVIPQLGYPELRVNFYHDTPIREINDVLASIRVALETLVVAFDQGELDESSQ